MVILSLFRNFISLTEQKKLDEKKKKEQEDYSLSKSEEQKSKQVDEEKDRLKEKNSIKG